MTIELNIDGKEVFGLEGETILDVARANGIDIPTLCHHKATPAWGGCRLCVVEIDGKLTTSCLYKIRKGLRVETHSPKVIENRKMILSLLMAQAPAAKEVRELAAKYGVDDEGFVKGEAEHKCITCGLCTRLCATQGTNAIATVDRGPDKKIGTSWEQPPADCIGCLACATNCPTGAIAFKESTTSRKIWKKNFKMVKCAECKADVHITIEQAKFYATKAGVKEDYFLTCEDCRRKKTMHKFLDVIRDPSFDIMTKWNAEDLPPLKMPSPTKEWFEAEARRLKAIKEREAEVKAHRHDNDGNGAVA